MKVLILAENLEVNRTSSGITCNNQIYAYSSFFDHVDVITATPKNLFKLNQKVKYDFLDTSSINHDHFFNKIPKINAVCNYLFGINWNSHQLIKLWSKKTIEKLKQIDYDFVVSFGSGASFIPAYAVKEIKKKYDIKHLMFIHDPYPLNQYPPPYRKKNTLPYQTVAKSFGKVINNANIVSFPSLRLLEWMNNYYPSLKHKSIIQSHLGFHFDLLEKILPKQKKEKLPVFENGINIVHTGTLLGPRTPLFLIQALDRLFKEEPEAKEILHLHIIGKMNKDWKANPIVGYNVHIYDKRFSYLDSLQIQKNADILLLIEAVSDVSPFMPGKLADYLMAEKPILALTPKASETTRILGNDYPLLVENGNIEKIHEKLLLLYKSYKNDTLKNLIPSSESYEYVLPENWYKSLKMISK